MGMLVQLVEASKKLRPETRRLYAGAVRGFETFCGSDIAAANANVDLVERWRDAQATRVKPETVNVRVLALRWAARRLADRTANETLARAARATELLPTARDKKPCPLTLEAVKKLVESCSGDRPVDLRDRAIITLAARTGLRRGGIAGIDIADYQPPLLTVTLKGGARHTLPPLDSETMAVLSAWRDCLQSEAGITTGRLFRSIRAQRDLKNRWVIGTSMNGQAVYRVIREHGEHIGLKLQAHDCRRFFVTTARHLGWPDWYVALWTGHRSSTGMMSSYPMLDQYTHTLNGSSPVAAALPAFS